MGRKENQLLPDGGISKRTKKKWFQVTYPTIQLPSGMHGRSCAIWVFVRIASLLPAPGFRPTRINALRRASRITPHRILHLGTTFRSLDKTVRFRTTFPRSMLLAYPFGSPLSLPQARSIQPLVHAIWLAPDGANFNTANPLPGSLCTTPTVLQTATSVWGFWTPPDQSVDLDTSREAHRISTPDFLRSPLPAVFSRTSSGSMFRTRYVPFGLLSNKPLGTFSTMLPNRICVNQKVIILTRFCTRF
jgi:hypothetical protein